jgi:hypothetical protein
VTRRGVLQLLQTALLLCTVLTLMHCGPRPSIAVLQPPVAQEELQAMDPVLQLVEQLCSQLCQEPPPAAQELVGKLGTIRRQSKSAVYVQAADLAFSSISIGLDLRNGSPKDVDLFLADATLLKVEALATRYGQPAIPPRVSWDSPTSLVFSWQRHSADPYVCVISADLAELGAQGAAQDRVRRITVMRRKS